VKTSFNANPSCENKSDLYDKGTVGGTHFYECVRKKTVWPLTTKDNSELAHFKSRPLCFLPIRYKIAMKLLPCQLTGKRSCIQQRSCQEADTTLDPNERSLQFQKKELIPEHLSIVNLCLSKKANKKKLIIKSNNRIEIRYFQEPTYQHNLFKNIFWRNCSIFWTRVTMIISWVRHDRCLATKI